MAKHQSPSDDRQNYVDNTVNENKSMAPITQRDSGSSKKNPDPLYTDTADTAQGPFLLT